MPRFFCLSDARCDFVFLFEVDDQPGIEIKYPGIKLQFDPSFYRLPID